MEKLLKEWNNYLKKEVKKHNRIVLNELAQLTEEEVAAFPISTEELEIIKHWGGLEGEPMFLGRGTMGSAFELNGKVLKITSDGDEASAAVKIAGQTHPNVYTILKVGQRQRRFTEMPQQRFVIIYDKVGDSDAVSSNPSKEAQDIIQSLHNTHETIKYNWPNNFFGLVDRMAQTVNDNPEALKIDIIRDNVEPIIDKLIELSGMKPNEGKAFKLAWAFINGFFGKECMRSPETFIGCMQTKKFDYMNQVCNGLTFLNQHGIMFKDLKTTNVLREEGDNLKIIDVGKSVVRGGSSIFEEIK